MRSVRRSVMAAGRAKLSIKPTGRAKRKLAKDGSVKLKAKVTFTPVGGIAASAVKLLRLRKAHP